MNFFQNDEPKDDPKIDEPPPTITDEQEANTENIGSQNIPKPITSILEETDEEAIPEETIEDNENSLEVEAKEVEEFPIIQDTTITESVETPVNLASGKPTKLQYGDIIQISSPDNTDLDSHIFYIDFINSSKIILIDNDTLDKKTVSFINGVIDNGSVKQIVILDRADSPSYAVQNNLMPESWIEITFMDGTKIVGKITDLEQDMCTIQLNTEDKPVIYIDFQYSGIPENSNIANISIVPEPTRIEEPVGMEMEEPSPEFNLDELEFEDVAPIKQILETNKSYLRYSIEEQTNDFLEVLLSKVPSSKRNEYMTKQFLQMISRFVQLRDRVSIFDKNNNILIKKDQKSYKVHDNTWKPLVQPLLEFNNSLYWILFVGQNIKRVYTEAIHNDIENHSLIKELSNFNNEMEKYKKSSEMMDQNRYIQLFRILNETNTFQTNPDDNTIITQPVLNNTPVVLDNYKSLASTGIKNDDMGTNIVENKLSITRYVTSIDYITQTELLKKIKTNFLPLINSDMLSLKSIMTLPEPTIYFSRVNLPGSNILERANLGSHFLHYWKLLNKKTKVTNITIEDLEMPIEYTEDNFINDIKNYSINLEENTNPKENYEKFLNSILPKTRVLFNLIKKNINGRLSFVDVVKYLEPFMIYPEDITFMQYKDINQFINGTNGMISKYITQFKDSKAIMNNIIIQSNKLERRSPFFKNYEANTFNTSEGVNDISIPGLYFELEDGSEEKTRNKELIVVNKLSTSEILNRIIELDNGSSFHSSMSLDHINLMMPDNISKLIEEDTQVINADKSQIAQNSTCKTYVISKKYKNEEKLLNDNDVDPIFFDKEYDDTNYGLMDDIEEDYRKSTGKKRINSSNEEFMEFTIKQLIKKYKYSQSDAAYTAESLMNGMKKVLVGQYAIIVTTNNDQTKPFVRYYLRENMKWIIQPDMNMNYTTNEDMCNIQDSCLYEKQTIDGKCIPTDTLLNKNEASVLKNLSQQMESDYFESVDKLKNYIIDESNYFTEVAYYKKFRRYKKNITEFNLGLQIAQLEIQTSPYAKYLELILQIPNFIEKQKLILLFYNKYCREPNPERLDILTGDMENPFWFYCNETGVKLLPKFLYDLAHAFLVSNNYNEMMTQIINRCGAISDDGDNWVDKYSGKIIKPIDFDVEEGYSKEGYKNVSREMLDEEEGKLMLDKPVEDKSVIANKYISNESKIIHNIIQTLSNNMKIDMKQHTDFIITKTRDLFFKICPSEAEYNLKVEESEKKGKKVQETYEDITNKILLYLSVSCYLIVAQTSIPIIKLKYSFPGCVASLKGYPFSSVGDLTAITYIACITLKLKSPYYPWKTLPKTKTKIMETLQEYLNSYFLTDIDIMHKIRNMNDYIVENPELEIMDETHSILKWKQFLPALVPIKIKGITNVSEDFIQSIIYNLKTGSNLQQDQLKVIESKIILFSYSIQELIYKNVANEELLLQNSNKQLYTENACCNNTSIPSTLDYFIDKNKDISIFNEIIHNFSIFLNDVNILTKPPIFLYKDFSIRKTVALPSTFNEETIYAAFIKYCNFKSEIPNSDAITAICGEKPSYIYKKDTLPEIINKIKSDHRSYNIDQLLLLLKTINKEHMLKLDNTEKQNTHHEQIHKLLLDLDYFNDSRLISKKLQQLLMTYMETFNMHDRFGLAELPEVSAIKKYLVNSNRDMRVRIEKFMTKYNNKQQETIKMMSFITSISVYKEGDTYNINTMCNFIKNCVSQLGKIFPSMIKTRSVYTISMPKYWGITKTHSSNLFNISNKMYNPIVKYYGVETLYKILDRVQEQTLNTILLTEKVPVLRHSSFNEELSVLLITHCLFLCINEYIMLTDDTSMIMGIEEQMFDEDKDENEALLGKQIVQSEKEIFKHKVAELLSDMSSILIQSKSNIEISYDDIMDNIFKLKEAEKNRLRNELQNLSEDSRIVNNQFKKYKIGKWAKGENVQYYDGDRYDEEFNIMSDLNEQEKQQQRGANANPLDVLAQTETDRFIEQDEFDREPEIDADDGDYYGEDE